MKKDTIAVTPTPPEALVTDATNVNPGPIPEALREGDYLNVTNLVFPVRSLAFLRNTVREARYGYVTADEGTDADDLVAQIDAITTV